VKLQLFFFRGVDLLDGTPILDIKPYIPEYDAPAFSSTDDAEETPLEDGNAKVSKKDIRDGVCKINSADKVTLLMSVFCFPQVLGEFTNRCFDLILSRFLTGQATI
jgi:hypothetical protein